MLGLLRSQGSFCGYTSHPHSSATVCWNLHIEGSEMEISRPTQGPSIHSFSMGTTGNTNLGQRKKTQARFSSHDQITVSLDRRREKTDKGLQYLHRVVASASTWPRMGGAASSVRRVGKLVKGRWKDRPDS